MSAPIRILHLEDNPRDAEMIRDLFDSGNLAIEIRRADKRQTYETALREGTYDLILCDNNLPDYDGRSALKLAREVCPLTPVVIISGSLGEEEAVKSLQFGATDYLLKGHLERLLPAVQRALEEARERRNRQQAEAELRQNEERMRLALAATNDGIWDWDLVAGRMVCNSTFADLFGAPSAQADLKQWWAERTHPDEIAEVTTSLNEAIARAGRFWSKTYCLRRRDGRWAHVHNRVCLATDATGRVVRLVGAVQDITEAMEAEEKRRLLEDQLRQAQKLDAIGVLAGGIAHDFNNILGIILTNADLARMDLPDDFPPDHGTLESLREISTAGNRARDLVRQILTFSRRGESQLAVMKVQPIVHECLQMLRSTIPAMVTIEKSIDPACSCIIGDPTQLHQVIMNLCTNAWHALPPHDGVIEVIVDQIEAGKAPLEAQTDPTVRHFVRISVRDNGHGMDATTKARIFEPFFTTKTAGQGTGLGLAVVHGIVKAHGGAIALESTPGQGTTFQLYFPAQNAELESNAPETSAIPRGAGEHVMLVDDDVAMGRAMQRFLMHQGYRVDLFHTPQAALEAFTEPAGNFDLVVTDYSMPGMTGIELTDALKHIRPHVPVLLMTGSMTFKEKHTLEMRGVQDFLAKPVPPETLATAIARALAERSTEAPPPGETRARPATILIIDDDPDFRAANLRLLQRAGYDALGASEGTEAMRIVRSTRVDVVLTDVLMPGTDGLETIVKLQQEFPDVRIIAMSGGGRISATDCLNMCQKLGVTVTLRKPFTPEELLGAVIEAVHGVASSAGGPTT